jgi:hypothetical protein
VEALHGAWQAAPAGFQAFQEPVEDRVGRSGESQNGAWPELLIRCFLHSQRLENGIVSTKSVLTNGSSAPLRTAIGGVLPATTLCHAGSNRLWLRHAGNVSLRPGEAVS